MQLVRQRLRVHLLKLVHTLRNCPRNAPCLRLLSIAGVKHRQWAAAQHQREQRQAGSVFICAQGGTQAHTDTRQAPWVPTYSQEWLDGRRRCLNGLECTQAALFAAHVAVSHEH